MCICIEYIYSYLYPECLICFEHRPLVPIQHVDKGCAEHGVCKKCYEFIMKHKKCPWCRQEIQYI